MARLYGVADGRARSRTTAAHRLRTRGYRRSDAVPTRRRVAVDARVAGIAVEPAGDRAAERVHDAAGRRRPRLLRSAGAVEAHERRPILPGRAVLGGGRERSTRNRQRPPSAAK